MDVDKLLKALDDNSNEGLLDLNTTKIRQMNLDILKELHLSRDETLDMMNKLREYRYIDEMNDLKYGTYLRWIPINDPDNITLTKGAIFCEMKIVDDGVRLVCKTPGYYPKHFQIKLDENLIFQKLTTQELVLLNALDHLSK